MYINIDIYTETVWTFSQAMAKNEEKTGKFDSFTKLSFVWRTLLINLKGFGTT